MTDQNTTPAPTGEAGEFAKRLRSLATRMAFAMGNGGGFWSLPSDIGRIGSAAALITAQAAEVERLRGALGLIAEGLTPPVPEGHHLAHRAAVKIARAALTTEKTDG